MVKYLRFLPLVLEFIIICYYYLKIRFSKFILRKSVIGKIAKLITPKRNTKKYIKRTSKLNKSLSRLDLLDIAAIKTSIIIIILTISILTLTLNTKLDLVNIIAVLLLLVIIAFVVSWVFNLVLAICINARIKHINIESVNLMNTLTIALSITPMSVIDVITMAIDKSYHLKKVFKRFSIAYIVDYKEAYNFYLLKRKNESFEKIINMMNLLEDENKYTILRNIKLQNKNYKDLQRDEQKSRKKVNDSIILIIFIIVIVISINLLLKFLNININFI